MGKAKKIRILLADDHLVVRMGIASIISYENDLEVVAEASDGREAVRLAKQLKPDLVLMDLVMPHMGGVEATAAIRADCPETRVIILTTYGTSADLKAAMDAGASGALAKTSSQTEIISALRETFQGGAVVSKEFVHALKSADAVPKLSVRQMETLTYIAKGFTNQEVADALGISIDTVKDYLKTIYSRLGVSSRAEAVSLAVSNGSIQP